VTESWTKRDINSPSFVSSAHVDDAILAITLLPGWRA